MKTAHSTANGARTWLQSGADRARQQAVDTAGSVDDYAHERPWPVAGLAAVAGIALGVLVARR